MMNRKKTKIKIRSDRDKKVGSQNASAGEVAETSAGVPAAAVAKAVDAAYSSNGSADEDSDVPPLLGSSSESDDEPPPLVESSDVSDDDEDPKHDDEDWESEPPPLAESSDEESDTDQPTLRSSSSSASSEEEHGAYNQVRACDYAHECVLRTAALSYSLLTCTMHI